MGREVSMVRPDWEHPKQDDGGYVPLLYNNGAFNDRLEVWETEYAKWQEGLRVSWSNGKKWVPIEDKYKDETYEEWAGSKPKESEYMPDWDDSECTHLMMYEDTTEGTPISPAFETPEELSRWLVDNNASAFGDDTATYEQWLETCKSGWVPSAVISDGQLKSGVAHWVESE